MLDESRCSERSASFVVEATLREKDRVVPAHPRLRSVREPRVQFRIPCAMVNTSQRAVVVQQDKYMDAFQKPSRVGALPLPLLRRCRDPSRGNRSSEPKRTVSENAERPAVTAWTARSYGMSSFGSFDERRGDIVHVELRDAENLFRKFHGIHEAARDSSSLRSITVSYTAVGMLSPYSDASSADEYRLHAL